MMTEANKISKLISTEKNLQQQQQNVYNCLHRAKICEGEATSKFQRHLRRPPTEIGSSIHKYSLSITCATLWPMCCESHCHAPPVVFYISGAAPGRLSFLAIAAGLVPPKGKYWVEDRRKMPLVLTCPLPVSTSALGSISSGECFSSTIPVHFPPERLTAIPASFT